MSVYRCGAAAPVLDPNALSVNGIGLAD